MVLKSFARLGCRPYGKPSATRTGCVRLSPCLRIDSASTAAGRLRGPALAWRGGEGCYVYRAAGCGHPAADHAPPLGRARRPCPTNFSCWGAPLCAAAGHTLGGGSAPPLLTTRKHPALLAMCHCEASAHTGCGNPSPPAFAQGYYGFPRCFAPRNDRRGFRQAQQNRRFWRKRRFCSFRGRGRMYGKEKYERLLIAGSQRHDAYDRQHTGQSGQNNIQEHTSDLLISICFS